MATIKKKTLKDGSCSYEIRVSLGRDINGKQILKYRTWTPEPKMTPKQIEKALEREKVMFEEQCRTGKVLDTNTKFADFAEQWLEANKDTFSPKYKKSAVELLTRINEAIGHLPLGKISPHHLQSLYNNLSEVGIKKVKNTAVSNSLVHILKTKDITRTKLSEISGLSFDTIKTACKGKRISEDSACKIAIGLNEDVNSIFEISNNKETLSKNSILAHHRIISTILETAVRWQVIYDNPAKRVITPKARKKEADYLDDHEAAQVAEAFKQAPLKWRVMSMLLMYSGMRRGEACGLDWNDVDFERNLVHITKSNQYTPNMGTFEKDTKNEYSNRVIKLPPEMMALLQEYQNAQKDECAKMGDRWIDSGKVFTQANGLPMHPDSITKWMNKFRKAHNLPVFTPKALRHTSATLLIMSGVPVKAVSSRLGHASQTTTNNIYSHAIQTVDAIASDVIGDILNKKQTSEISETH